MKALFYLATAFLIISLSISCENDETTDNEKPMIEDLEVGHNDTIHAGGKAHVSFSASDNDVLDYFRIVIHYEGEHDHKSAVEEHEWELDTTIYDNFSGLKNASPHYDFDIDEHAELGEYHFDLTVVDKSGNSSTMSQDLIMAEHDGDYDHDHDH